MNIPQLHTNLLWDLGCLTILLTGLYFSCIIFFRSPFWKTFVTSACPLEILHPGKYRIQSKYKGEEGNDPGNSDIDYTSQKDHSESIGPEMGQGGTINDIEVDYEVLIDPAIEKQIHEILETYAREHREKEIIFYRDKERDNGNRGEEDILDFGNIALPTAKFYDKKEHKRVKLLYAIAELGDAREVPLLQGMLDQERNESISILIKEIILGFLSERPAGQNREPEVQEIGHLCEHYVYKYLFRAIDTESQHLLLDEVLKIGGQEELNFLRTLALHPDESIREKARIIGDQLEQKLLPSGDDGTTTDFEVAKLKRNDLKNWAGISLVRRFGTMSGPKFQEIGTWATSRLKVSAIQLSKIVGDIMGNKPLDSPVIMDKAVSKGKGDILHIDFELDFHEIEDQEIYPDNGKKETLVSNRSLRPKQWISTVLNKMGNLPRI